MKDKHKTKVMFKIITWTDPEGSKHNTIDALFPDMVELNGCVGGYSHIGQHSIYHKDFLIDGKVGLHKVKTATKKEYKELFKELESIGYNLEIVK